ncbi:MAG: DUF1844 domain-containing protein [Candidatus Omnitrophica bacterium]|nr:DUF1844 domain-containing protein [Candidatus Omnitrophota bacterium]MCM8770974.1 DUF1844 domain-containing protein [Candidatus Omnitrophota bacterium]
MQEETKDFIPPEPTFNLFVSTLAMQVSIFLGAMPNPITEKKEENLPQAKFIIDTLDMLKTKTKGNLTPEEEKYLEEVLYNLRMFYLEKTKGVSEK